MDYQKDAAAVVNYIGRLVTAGAAMARDFADPKETALPAAAGIFAGQYREWKPGEDYAAGEPVQYKGAAYQVQQPVAAALESQAPDMPGLLALYTPYPAPDRRGHYPYTYGMHVEAGMIEIDPSGGRYRAISGMATQLNPPSELPAIFEAYPFEG
ncbi:carbohydrate-binding protein [Anaerotruncus massiliensis (ex Liu et al. 2021)]|uniref:carbohydrate-binding protein n=1 Tax=Anaerotruncus massiliensis (ex Liu et al. 2021) TaxID=2321404 RepID=UPI003AF71FF1